MVKKAQAAMEFLMTYGWAILVVLVVIGALAYFGVLNPQTLLPERCELQQGFYCRDYLISEATDTITMKLENGRGQGIMVGVVNATGVGELAGVQCYNETFKLWSWAGKDGKHLTNGESAEFVLYCQPNSFEGLANSGKKKFDLTVSWYQDDSTPSFNHTMTGQLLANIEE
ncbi:hypothetical protein JXB11_01355 [Candidatus Woesearchaeota archaeon]|nr:hypothetical protein [Candidatus Woesearchaeota archaeon]